MNIDIYKEFKRSIMNGKSVLPIEIFDHNSIVIAQELKKENKETIKMLYDSMTKIINDDYELYDRENVFSLYYYAFLFVNAKEPAQSIGSFIEFRNVLSDIGSSIDNDTFHYLKRIHHISINSSYKIDVIYFNELDNIYKDAYRKVYSLLGENFIQNLPYEYHDIHYEFTLDTLINKKSINCNTLMYQYAISDRVKTAIMEDNL